MNHAWGRIETANKLAWRAEQTIGRNEMLINVSFDILRFL